MTKQVRLMILLLMAMVIPAAAPAQETFKRDIEQYSFIPKGQWITGVSVGYSQSNQSNYQFFVFENLSGDTYTFKVTPMALYAFKDNLAAGIKFGYTRSNVGLDNGSFKLDSETYFDADNLNAISQDYFAIAALRNYISLGSNRRFGIFNELQLELGGGQSKFSNYTGDGANRHMEGTFEKNFSLNLGLTPGFVMFLNNYSAIEVSVGVLGFGYTHTKAVTNQVEIARRNSKHANFKINLFSVQFGMAFYL
ncbi:MAG: hypothetical protein NC338_03655 [Firmicutes bacterium]|nr:hypothetical protein [Bacillota bacterium]MCM1401333.1 hypothetical protein [Bacteroides sp.]MCM1477286.1 hypothetical protein [Bacteroides sp.]